MFTVTIWKEVLNYFKTITLGLTATLARIDEESFWITLNHHRLEFLNLLKGFIIEREKVEKKDLFNAPFTVIHPLGIRGVFSPAQINEILHFTERLAA